MNKDSRVNSKKRHRETDPVIRAIQVGVNKVLLDHKRSGNPVVFADEQGRPVWVPAEEIVIPPLEEPKPRRRSKHDA